MARTLDKGTSRHTQLKEPDSYCHVLIFGIGTGQLLSRPHIRRNWTPTIYRLSQSRIASERLSVICGDSKSLQDRHISICEPQLSLEMCHGLCNAISGEIVEKMCSTINPKATDLFVPRGHIKRTVTAPSHRCNRRRKSSNHAIRAFCWPTMPATIAGLWPM